jgi:hypothetical protein
MSTIAVRHLLDDDFAERLVKVIHGNAGFQGFPDRLGTRLRDSFFVLM